MVTIIYKDGFCTIGDYLGYDDKEKCFILDDLNYIPMSEIKEIKWDKDYENEEEEG